MHAGCSLATLKRKLAEAQARKSSGIAAAPNGGDALQSKDGGGADDGGAQDKEPAAATAMPIEAERILTEEDFERIRWVAVSART
jgi:hypothetical protein